MRYATGLYCVAALLGPLVALAANDLRPAPEPGTLDAVRDVTRNPRPSIEQRLRRIEQLSAELQREAAELRVDLHPRLPQTQPVKPLPDDQPLPDVRFQLR